MKNILDSILTVEPKRLLIYVIIYFVWGMLMNWIGQTLEIAKFIFWWQIITCYVLFMIPVSLIVRPYPFFTQYAYGLVAIGILEFCGYALGTSYIYPANILDKLFGPHVFALGMSLFFALYFPVGNWVVHKIYSRFVQK